MGARYRKVVEGPRGRPGVKAEDFDWLSSDQDVIATAKPPQNLLNFSSMGTWSKVARYVGGSLEAMQRCDAVLPCHVERSEDQSLYGPVDPATHLPVSPKPLAPSAEHFDPATGPNWWSSELCKAATSPHDILKKVRSSLRHPTTPPTSRIILLATHR
jgi:hypothetical protein